MIERAHMPFGRGMSALGLCVMRTARLLATNRIRQPRGRVGNRCTFADGTTAMVYRETLVERFEPRSPTVLVVCFRLRHVRSDVAHSLFRLESELNTVLFVGFPGFKSKLWFAHDERGLYRGLYDWDDPELAEKYVRALWWALRVVSVPESIHYAILPGLCREDLLHDPHLADDIAPEERTAWWRLAAVEG